MTSGGILTNKATFNDRIPGPGEKSHQRKPSEDFILGTTSSLSVIQSNVAKMSIKSPTPPPESHNGHPPEAPVSQGAPGGIEAPEGMLPSPGEPQDCDVSI